MTLFILSLILLFIFFSSVLLLKGGDLFSPGRFNLYSFILPTVISTIGYCSAGIVTFSEEVLYFGAMLIFLMGFFFAIGYIFGLEHDLLSKVLSYMSVDVRSALPRIKIILGCFVGFYISILFILMFLTHLDPISSPLYFRITASHDYGMLYAFYLAFPFYILVFSFFYNYAKKSVASGRIFWSIFIFILIIEFFSGSRWLLLNVLIITFVARKFFYNQSISKKGILLGSIVFVPFFVIYNIYRISGVVDIASIGSILDDPILLWEFILRQDTVVNTLSMIRDYQNGNLNLLYGRSIIDAILTIVPRAIYPDKPLMLNIELHKHFKNIFSEGTLDMASAYIMAEAFLNFHFLGVMLYSFLWGLITASLDLKYLTSMKNESIAAGFLMFYSFGFNANFLMEGFNSMPFQQMLISYCFTHLLLFMLKVRIKF